MHSATHESVAVSGDRDRKIRTALWTSQITLFVTMLSWKKVKEIIYTPYSYALLTTYNRSNKRTSTFFNDFEVYDCGGEVSYMLKNCRRKFK